MDLAYDHITSQSLPEDEEGKDHTSDNGDQSNNTLNADFQAAYTALSASASPWASRIGGFFGNVVKQGESVYREAQQEVTALGQDASKGLTGLREQLVSRTRGLSIATTQADANASSAAETTPTAEGSSSSIRAAAGSGSAEEEANVLARIKGEATKRLRDLQRAEEAADEALIKFGTNLRDFLREAITIAPPTEGNAAGSGSAGNGSSGSTVLFESKDAQGKRVIHTSRFDAQLHVIHMSPDSFAKDPSASEEFTTWSSSFDIDMKTEDIAADLNKYPELRTTMEKLVPATIPYADFWKRYYFLRHGIETAEARRRDLLKAASTEEEIAWDEDSDDEAETAAVSKVEGKRSTSTESSTTIHPPSKAPAQVMTSPDGLLKPSVTPRKSDEKSVADSEASYDMVGAKSGAPSQAPNSPRRVDEDSEEEDWE